MATYSTELKEKIIKQMLPPVNLSIKELSDHSGIPQGTLYNWRQRQILKGIAMPSNKSPSSKAWTPEQN